MSESTPPLAARACIPCRGGVPPLSVEEREKLLTELEGWEIVSGHHLTKDYRFSNFVLALDFTNQLGELAEREGHHPEITVGWGHARVEIWTHKINGLTESDFVLAAKCDALLAR